MHMWSVKRSLTPIGRTSGGERLKLVVAVFIEVFHQSLVLCSIAHVRHISGLSRLHTQVGVRLIPP